MTARNLYYTIRNEDSSFVQLFEHPVRNANGDYKWALPQARRMVSGPIRVREWIEKLFRDSKEREFKVLNVRREFKDGFLITYFETFWHRKAKPWPTPCCLEQMMRPLPAFRFKPSVPFLPADFEPVFTSLGPMLGSRSA